ncbi:hypothetical protein OHB26_39355 (plasmid) [Nocardia sp. NBC_01503]|uniref:hypothetical protein n=1 Tax=Nocardia sp. NBC_01503 TaxID=2975997 RepID=UPI002E7C1FDA|nr:hypothetical protein [Nocardia sp. NBC_01503]WTL36710.1 hypothetical protein OHB26_39220 [Nocardia sp. NBC_01503]WTL36737.1 hypothetical protein OHB26_39355 [Nocardia sp. NBC_01503]
MTSTDTAFDALATCPCPCHDGPGGHCSDCCTEQLCQDCIHRLIRGEKHTMNSTNTSPDQADTRPRVQVQSLHHGMVTVAAEIVAEHFAITPHINDNGAPAVFGLSLVHIPTGRHIPVDGFPCREELRELGQALAALPLEWATTTSDSISLDQLQSMHESITAWDKNRRNHVHGCQR